MNKERELFNERLRAHLGIVANSVFCLIQELENGNSPIQEEWDLIYYFLETSREYFENN